MCDPQYAPNPADDANEYRLNEALKKLRKSVRQALNNKFICDLLARYPGNERKKKYSSEDTDIEREKYISAQIELHISAYSLTTAELQRLARTCELATHNKTYGGMFDQYFPSMVGMAVACFMFVLGFQSLIVLNGKYEVPTFAIGVLAVALSMVTFQSKKQSTQTQSEIEVDKLLAYTLKDKSGID